MHRWPAVIQETMWPFAIRHAVAFHNASIQKGAQHSPHYLFTGEDPPTQLHDFRVFGSPTYVLKKELQDGTKLNKWCERSWQGAYIGHSFCLKLWMNIWTNCSLHLHIGSIRTNTLMNHTLLILTGILLYHQLLPLSLHPVSVNDVTHRRLLIMSLRRT